MILSGNSIEHALMTLGAYGAGVPAAPVSPAYSLMSTDHGKLKHCFDKVAPAWSSPRAARCSTRPSPR
jgi:feruloyl-CoA synthase